jgi:hypothetical protein
MNGFTPEVQHAMAVFLASHPNHTDAGPFWQRKWNVTGRDGQQVAYEERRNRFVHLGEGRDEIMVLDWAAVTINGERAEGPLIEIAAKARAFLDEHEEAFSVGA